MIAKGLDFPGVTVVGIVSADAGLHLPDFRAAERTFQLLAQVAGRAGRGDQPGRIIVQTQTPEHPAIVLASRHDFVAFARAEQELRREVGYPPHGRLLRVILEDEDESRVRGTAEPMGEELRRRLHGHPAQVLGPAPAPIARLRGRFRDNLLVKAPPGIDSLDRAREAVVELAGPVTRPRISIDVDPVGML
jgi:primosomal protein N' (replication factor Y)